MLLSTTWYKYGWDYVWLKRTSWMHDDLLISCSECGFKIRSSKTVRWNRGTKDQVQLVCS